MATRSTRYRIRSPPEMLSPGAQHFAVGSAGWGSKKIIAAKPRRRLYGWTPLLGACRRGAVPENTDRMAAPLPACGKLSPSWIIPQRSMAHRWRGRGRCRSSAFCCRSLSGRCSSRKAWHAQYGKERGISMANFFAYMLWAGARSYSAVCVAHTSSHFTALEIAVMCAISIDQIHFTLEPGTSSPAGVLILTR